MSVAEKLQKELNTELIAARGIAAKAEAESRELDASERAALKSHFDNIASINERAAAAKGDDDMLAKLNEMGLSHGVPTIDGPASPHGLGGKSLTTGQKFTEADSVKSWFKSLAPNGELSKNTRVHSPAIAFGGMKDILATGGGTTGMGNLVNSDRLGLIDQGMFQRPLTLADLVTRGQTGSDMVEFVREAGFTNNAAPVAEAQGATTSVGGYVAGTGNVSGIKPQSSFALEPDSVKVVALAHWVPVTKRALSDAGQIRSLIDTFLRYGLEEEIENQIATGDGTGENFRGILETEGRQTQAWDTNLLTTTRRAKTKVRTVGRATATAYVFNPADNERFDLLQNNNGDFIFGAPTGNQQQVLWGLPRIESEAIPEGTGLVADWRRAILWDREAASIQLSDQHLDFFVRNLVAILAELRAAFTVIRPSAFVEIDLTAGA